MQDITFEKAVEIAKTLLSKEHAESTLIFESVQVDPAKNEFVLVLCGYKEGDNPLKNPRVDPVFSNIVTLNSKTGEVIRCVHLEREEPQN